MQPVLGDFACPAMDNPPVLRRDLQLESEAATVEEREPFGAAAPFGHRHLLDQRGDLPLVIADHRRHLPIRQIGFSAILLFREVPVEERRCLEGRDRLLPPLRASLQHRQQQHHLVALVHAGAFRLQQPVPASRERRLLIRLQLLRPAEERRIGAELLLVLPAVLASMQVQLDIGRPAMQLLLELAVGGQQLFLARLPLAGELLQQVDDARLEVDQAAGRHRRQHSAPLAFALARTRIEQAQLDVGIAVVADEIDDDAAFLALMQAQTAAHLLGEDGQRLRRPHEQQRVDGRDIDSLVEQIHGENDVQLSRRQPPDRLSALRRTRLGAEADGRRALIREETGQEIRLRDRGAEPDRTRLPMPQPGGVDALRHLLAQLDGLQLRFVVAAAQPGQLRVVRIVIDPVVAERAEPAFLDRFDEMDLERHVAVAERVHILAVQPLRRRGDAEQERRLEIVQQRLIRLGRGVMEFVDDDQVERVRSEALAMPLRPERVDRGEDKLRLVLFGEAVVQSRGLVRHDMQEGLLRLQEDLLAVGDEQHAAEPAAGQEGGEVRLAEAGGHDDHRPRVAFVERILQRFERAGLHRARSQGNGRGRCCGFLGPDGGCLLTVALGSTPKIRLFFLDDLPHELRVLLPVAHVFLLVGGDHAFG